MMLNYSNVCQCMYCSIWKSVAAAFAARSASAIILWSDSIEVILVITLIFIFGIRLLPSTPVASSRPSFACSLMITMRLLIIIILHQKLASLRSLLDGHCSATFDPIAGYQAVHRKQFRYKAGPIDVKLARTSISILAHKTCPDLHRYSCGGGEKH